MSHPSTMASTLNTSSLRQSARQTRTNPVRNSKAIGRSLFTLGRQSSFASAANEPSTAQNHTSNNNTNEQHGFYPAIEAFTDALNTLPREYRRHVSLLKEVDAKAWATEEHVQTLLTAAPTIPLYADSVAASVAGATHDETQSQTFSQVTDPGFDSLRRHFFNELRYNLSEMMVSMDEKNHLISNAHDEVQRRLTRIETIHPWIDQELSDEARYGSLTHWAYFQQNPSKPTVAESGRAERTRREVAAANNTAPGNHDTETAARSESRREAMLARKQRLAAQHADSDFDDPRPQSAARRGANGGPRGKRVAEAAGDAAASGTAAAATAPKKRKVEKTAAAAAAAMERSTSNRLTSTAMSRETSNAEPTKKRARPAAGLTRKRNNGAASPSVVSSPVIGSVKELHRASPAPTSAARPQTARGRQNSTQTGNARPQSAASNKNARSGNTPDGQTATNGRNISDNKNATRETLLSKSEPVNGDALSSALASTSAKGERSLKREDDHTAASAKIPTPKLAEIQLATVSTGTSSHSGRGKASKTSTPVVSTFAESTSGAVQPRSRPSRANTLTSTPDLTPQPSSQGLSSAPAEKPPTAAKRSHKKGAGLAAQLAAAAAARGAPSSASSHAHPSSKYAVHDDPDTDMGEGDGGDGDGEIYCFCRGGAGGDMIGCDGKDCPIGWFHWECVGITKAPGSRAKWYCPDCKEKMRSGSR